MTASPERSQGVPALCERCGESFRCGASAGVCWCSALELSDNTAESVGGRQQPVSRRFAQAAARLPRRPRRPHQPPHARLRATPITPQKATTVPASGSAGRSWPTSSARSPSAPPDSIPIAHPRIINSHETAAPRAAVSLLKTSAARSCPGQIATQPAASSRAGSSRARWPCSRWLCSAAGARRPSS